MMKRPEPEGSSNAVYSFADSLSRQILKAILQPNLSSDSSNKKISSSSSKSYSLTSSISLTNIKSSRSSSNISAALSGGCESAASTNSSKELKPIAPSRKKSKPSPLETIMSEHVYFGAGPAKLPREVKLLKVRMTICCWRK